MRKSLPIALVTSMLAGCASVTSYFDEEANEQKVKVDRHSTFPAVRRLYFEQVNLLELVDPEGKTKSASLDFAEAWKTAEENTDSFKRYGRQYDLVLGWFRSSNGMNDEEKRRARNSVQERILSVSTSRCNVFKTHLRRDHSDKNYFFGSLTTVSGVLGAVLQGANSSRNLAGAAGLFSGLQAEYNQAYFSNLTAQVIVRGIEARQAATYERIRKLGQSMSITEYPMEAAIKDAIYYDGLCSTLVGLDEASESIRLAQNPGLEAATRTVLRSRVLQRVANDDLEKLTNDDVLSHLGITLSDIYATPVAVPIGNAGSLGAFSTEELFRSIDKTQRMLEGLAQQAGNDLAQQYVNREKELIDKLPAPTAGTPAVTPSKKENIASKFTALLYDALIKPVDFQQCIARMAPIANAIAAAENNLRTATKEEDRILARKELTAKQLEGETKRRSVLANGDLVRVDLHSAAQSREKRIAEATALSGLQGVLTPGDIPVGASSKAGCSTL